MTNAAAPPCDSKALCPGTKEVRDMGRWIGVSALCAICFLVGSYVQTERDRAKIVEMQGFVDEASRLVADMNRDMQVMKCVHTPGCQPDAATVEK